jgi:hypothetical protein
MTQIAPNVSAAAAYGTKFAKGIILKFWKSLADQGITVYPNIKGPTKFGKMSAGKGLKPYTGTFDPTGTVTFTDRQLTPALATYEMTIQVLKYFNTWMADQINASITKKKIPFENAMWQQVVAEIADELITSLVYLGDITYVGSDEARKITDGFQLIIADINPTPTTTGAITASDVIDQLESVYQDIPSTKRRHPMNLYCSLVVADLYNKKYRELYHDKPTYNEFGQSALDMSGGRCKITPVDWLTGDEIIIAPKENMVLGTDSESDMSAIKTIETIYGFDAACTFSVGFQIPDPEMLFINDIVLAGSGS